MYNKNLELTESNLIKFNWRYWALNSQKIVVNIIFSNLIQKC